MARFSQAFLQSLTQPSYGEGLFEFGKGLSMTPVLFAEQKAAQERTARMASMFNIKREGTRAHQAGQTGTLEDSIVDLESMLPSIVNKDDRDATKKAILELESLLPDARKIEITNGAKAAIQIQTLLKDPNLSDERKAALTNQFNSLIADSDINAAYTTARRANRSAELEAIKTEAEISSIRNDNVSDYVVGFMLNNNLSEVPTEIQTPSGTVKLTEDQIELIKKDYVEKQTTDENFQKMVDGGALEPEYIDWINNNQDVIENNPALQASIRIINQTEGNKSLQRTRALESVRTLLDAESKRKRDAKRTKSAYEPVVNTVIETVLTGPDLVWGGGTLQDFFNDPEREDDVETFKSQAIQHLLEGGEKTDEAIIQAGMAGMKRFIPEQGLQTAREAAAAEEAALREDSIKDIMDDFESRGEPITRREAEKIFEDYLRQQAYEPLSQVSEFGAI